MTVLPPLRVLSVPPDQWRTINFRLKRLPTLHGDVFLLALCPSFPREETTFLTLNPPFPPFLGKARRRPPPGYDGD